MINININISCEITAVVRLLCGRLLHGQITPRVCLSGRVASIECVREGERESERVCVRESERVCVRESERESV